MCRRKQEYSCKRVYLFIVFRELHLMESPDTEAIFSVLCSSVILKQHNIIKRLRHFFALSLICTNNSDLPEYRITCAVASALMLTASIVIMLHVTLVPGIIVMFFSYHVRISSDLLD